MRVGKIPESVLKRSVLKQISCRRPEVLVRAAVGEDCSMLELEQDEIIVLSTDPITGTINDIGTLAVHVTANDIVSSGAEVIGVMLTILLPDECKESELKKIMQEIEQVCNHLNIEVLGGHTEVTDAVNQPIITVTGVGKVKKKDRITTSGMKAGQDIVMTKWAGLEGTAIIAKEYKKELNTRYSIQFIEKAESLLQFVSVVKEAKIAKEIGVTSMHDVTEGGIFGALWEMGACSNVGLEVDLKKIALKQETVEICEFYNINPYLLVSSGVMLFSTNFGYELVQRLEREGIPASLIGKVTKGKDRIIKQKGEDSLEECRYLEPPRGDELYKIKSNK